VSQYWTFKKGAGDKPTLPIVVFQVYALEVYDDFIRLLKKVRPSQVERLPGDKDAIIRTKGVEKLIRMLRDAFQNNPLVAQSMLEASKKTKAGPPWAKEGRILTSLIKMYQGPNSRYLNFYGPPGTIPTVCYYQVLPDQEKSIANHRQISFKSKAVFVGLSERLRPEQKDGFYTVFSQPSGIDMSGVEIAATAFANLLEDMPVRPLSPKAHIAVMMTWGMLVGILCRLFSTVISGGTMIGLGVICLVAAQYQFKQTGTWYPLVFPLFFQAPFAFFGAVLWKYFDTNKERQNLKMAFGYYLPDRAVDQLAKDIAYIKTLSETVYGTLLFTDVGRYTKLAEKFTEDPEKLRNIMSKYYEVLFKPVKRHGGRVSDIIGDAMLAIWATENPDAESRNKGCYAALDIASDVDQLEYFSTLGLRTRIEHPTRIGLHYGRIELGNVGASDHYEYRPTGDVVNTGSRMEGLNLGKFRPVGKSKPISVHELICLMEKCEEKQKRLCESFPMALKTFRRQSWNEAIEIFQDFMRSYGQDGPSEFFIRKCKEYKANPPGEAWDGVIDLKNK
jgi:adenylate cyclase